MQPAELAGVPILIFANKQDLVSALTAEEVIKIQVDSTNARARGNTGQAVLNRRVFS
jgi:hypothetical protein